MAIIYNAQCTVEGVQGFGLGGILTINLTICHNTRSIQTKRLITNKFIVLKNLSQISVLWKYPNDPKMLREGFALAEYSTQQPI